VRVLIVKFANLTVRSSADLPSEDLPNATALKHATASGNFETLALLLDAGADIDEESGEHGDTVLSFAATKGLVEMASFLIEYGANVNVRRALDGWTPLSVAAAAGHTDMVGLLLAHGADIEAGRMFSSTAQALAKTNGHKEILKLLRQAKKDRAGGKSSGMNLRWLSQ
jgi:ankyrin repeat domain-containing protein 17